MKRIWLTTLVPVLALVACAMGSPVYTAEPFSAQVVDAETGQPIAGAVVVANWELVGASLHGRRHLGQLEVKETVTDDNGRFHFDGFTRPNFALSELHEGAPRVLVFKGGYKANAYYSYIDPPDLPRSTRKAGVDGQVLKLVRLKPTKTGPKDERLEFHFSLRGLVSDIVRDCQWSNIPRLLQAMDREKRRLRAEQPGADVGIGVEDFVGQSRLDCKLDADTVRGYLR